MKIKKTKQNNIYYIQLDDTSYIKVTKNDDHYILNIDNANLFHFASRSASRIEYQPYIPNIPTEKICKSYDIKLSLDKKQLSEFINKISYNYNKFVTTINKIYGGVSY